MIYKLCIALEIHNEYIARNSLYSCCGWKENRLFLQFCILATLSCLKNWKCFSMQFHIQLDNLRNFYFLNFYFYDQDLFCHSPYTTHSLRWGRLESSNSNLLCEGHLSNSYNLHLHNKNVLTAHFPQTMYLSGCCLFPAKNKNLSMLLL